MNVTIVLAFLPLPHAARKRWQEILKKGAGVGTDVTGVGGHRMCSVGRGTLELVLAPEGSKPGDTAHLLTGPLVASHAAFKLPPIPIHPSRVTRLELYFLTVSCGSIFCYLRGLAPRWSSG